MVFEDIVDSTKRAQARGDQGWRDLLNAHDNAVRHELSRFRGKEVKSLGDGFLATFDGPARAIHCAGAIAVSRRVDLPVRIGVHIEVVGGADDRLGDGSHRAVAGNSAQG